MARNHGVDEAKSDLIAFLDADDEWTPSHLKTILRLQGRYPEAGMYTTTFQIFAPDGKARQPDYQCMPGRPWEGLIPNYFKSAAIGECIVCASVVCIPKNIFLKMGGFPTGCGWGEDGYLFGKIGLNYPVAFSWEIGGIYHFDATDRACNKGLSLDREEPFITFGPECPGKRRGPVTIN